MKIQQSELNYAFLNIPLLVSWPVNMETKLNLVRKPYSICPEGNDDLDSLHVVEFWSKTQYCVNIYETGPYLRNSFCVA